MWNGPTGKVFVEVWSSLGSVIACPALRDSRPRFRHHLHNGSSAIAGAEPNFFIDSKKRVADLPPIRQDGII